jgi:dihydroxyacetone kinase-like predicted kinase
MGEALATVASIEVTQAVRATTLGGLAVAAGQFIGLLEGEVVTSGDSPEAALESTLERVGLSSGQVVTLYRGQDARPEAAEEVQRWLERRAPGIQADLVYGGQPHYHYLASVE